MIVRVINLIVIGALILAAAYVYRIKFDSTVQAEHLAKLRSEVRHERDAIASLRARWGQLDNPVRIETLAKRFTALKPITPTQFDSLDRLPERPSVNTDAAASDPIGGVIDSLEAPDAVTGTVPVPADKEAATPAPTEAPAAAAPPTLAPPPDITPDPDIDGPDAPAADGAPAR